MLANLRAELRAALDLGSTPIGRGFDTRTQRWVAMALATGVLVVDGLFVVESRSLVERSFLALVGVVALVLVLDGDAGALGLRRRAAPSYGWWLRAGLLAGVVFLLIVVLLLLITRVHPPANRITQEWYCQACVLAPIVEESLYRVVLVPPLVALLGPWRAVVVSGLLFAGLHHLYGNVGPDNQLAGFLMTWAYLRSGSVVVPVTFHAVGNMVALLSQHVRWLDVVP